LKRWPNQNETDKGPLRENGADTNSLSCTAGASLDEACRLVLPLSGRRIGRASRVRTKHGPPSQKEHDRAEH